MATTFNLDVVFDVEVDNTVFGKLDEDRDDIACDEFAGPQYIEVADGASDQAISLGPLTTAYSVMVVSDQAVTLKHNGATTVLTLRANEPVVLPTITALTVSNASGSTAYLKVIMAGT